MLDIYLGVLYISGVTSTIRDLFPFGDLDPSTVGRAADIVPGLPAEEIATALDMARAVVEMLEELSRPLADHALSPARWRLLIALRFQSGDDGASIGDLAGHLGVREPTVTATVDRAENDGLVERRRDARDGRVVRVVLTDEGRRTLGSLIPVIAGRVAALTDAIGGVRDVEAITRAIGVGTAAMVSAAPFETGPIPR